MDTIPTDHDRAEAESAATMTPERPQALDSAVDLTSSGPPEEGTGTIRHLMSVRVLDLSAIATVKAIGYLNSYFYIVGGVASVLSSYLPGWSTDANVLVVRAVGVIAIVSGIGLIPFVPRMPRWAFHLPVLGGSVLISVSVLSSGSPAAAAAAATVYVYVLMGAVIYFAGVGMLLEMAVCCAAAAASMAHVGVGAAPITMMLVVGLALSLMVAWLARVSSAAELDQLTKLLNRRGFETRIQEAIATVERGGAQLAFVFIDIDDFKGINDGMGHHAGDRVLKRAADVWRVHVGDRGTLGRFGGDEFTLLLPRASLGQAADLADELRSLLPNGVTASAGVTAWQLDDTPSTLTGRADIALYEAKDAGRDRTVVYGDPNRTASELEAAIANDELFLEFQPVFDLDGGRMRSFEALVRWNHPRKGRILPGEFIPQAERTGAIHALGRWTLDRACRAAAASGTEDSPVCVAVNVSIPELRYAGYPAVVQAVLEEHGIVPGQITVEVTEAVFDDDEPQVTTTLRSLRELGVRLAIDDFGSGYSSLRWLDRFPVDVLKVDRAFVEPITAHDQDAPVLRGIINIGRTLGLSVIVEGVETPEQTSVLRAAGADLVQGFLFGRPAPLEDERLPAAVG